MELAIPTFGSITSLINFSASGYANSSPPDNRFWKPGWPGCGSSPTPPQALPWQVASAKSLLGGCRSAQKKSFQALPLLQTGYDGLAKDAAAIPAEVRGQRLAEAAERLAKHYVAVGEPAKAKEWQAKAEGHGRPAGK